MATLLPRAASVAAGIAVKGGAITMSQWRTSLTSGKNAEKNARVSACVLNIFQLPAITRRRLGWLIFLAESLCGLCALFSVSSAFSFC